MFNALSIVNLLRGVFVVLFWLLSFSSPAIAASAFKSGEAVVMKIVGAATYLDDAAKEASLTIGMKLSAGTTVTTVVGSAVQIDLGPNGGILLVKSGSEVCIHKLDYVSTGESMIVDTQLEIKKGGISGNVKKLSALSKYEVKTPNGAAVIRGTTYSLYADGTVQVFSGKVAITYIVKGVLSQPVMVIGGQVSAPPSLPGGTPVVHESPTDPKLIIDRFPLPEFPPVTIFVSPTVGSSPPVAR